jgi:hypothetical protein
MSWHLCGTQLEGSCEGRSPAFGVRCSAFDTSSHPHAFAA